MRDYYDCQRLATLDHASSTPRSPAPHDGFEPFSGSGHFRHSCFPHACMDYGAVMAAELDVARVPPQAHAPDALVICSGAAGEAAAAAP